MLCNSEVALRCHGVSRRDERNPDLCLVITSRQRTRRASKERGDRTLGHLVYPVCYFTDKEVREMCETRPPFFRKRKDKNTRMGENVR